MKDQIDNLLIQLERNPKDRKYIEAFVDSIREEAFEEGYAIARRNYELPMTYSKWLEHGEKFGYLKHYNKQNEQNN
jgi:hypothetical protein